MKKFILIAGLIWLSGLIAGNAWALTLDFSILANANIQFNGSTDSFGFTNNSTGFSFAVTDSDSTGQSAIGLDGNIAGSFGVGTVTNISGFYSAPVTGIGKLSISDGTQSLTANLVFLNTRLRSVESDRRFLNLEGLVNLTSIAYGGSNADLLSLESAGEAMVTASFTFFPDLHYSN